MSRVEHLRAHGEVRTGTRSIITPVHYMWTEIRSCLEIKNAPQVYLNRFRVTLVYSDYFKTDVNQAGIKAIYPTFKNYPEDKKRTH